MIDEEERAGKGRPELKIYTHEKDLSLPRRPQRPGKSEADSGYIGGFRIEVSYNSTGGELML